MKRTLIIFIILVVIAGATYLAYRLYFKEKIIEISSDRVSELLNMEVSFDGYSILGNTVEFTGLQIQSPYPQSDYDKVNKFQTDWISAKLGKVRLRNFDLVTFLNSKHFLASSVEVDSVEVDVYRNKMLPDAPIKHKPLITSLLMNINTTIQVDTISISNANIRYFERTEHSSTPGMIGFSGIDGTLHNLSNDPQRIKENPNMDFAATAKIFEDAKFDCTVRFNLASKEDNFILEANFNPFKAEILNRMIEGVLPIEITGGKVQEMIVKMEANEDRAVGTLDLQYDNMHIKVVTEEDSKIKSFLMTQVANIAIKTNNLPGDNNFQLGEIRFERIKDKFIFNYWWKSIKSGIMDVMMSDAGKLLQSKKDKTK